MRGPTRNWATLGRDRDKKAPEMVRPLSRSRDDRSKGASLSDRILCSKQLVTLFPIEVQQLYDLIFLPMLETVT